MVDSDAAKAAEERGRKESQFVGNGDWGPDPGYKGKALQLSFTVEDDGVFTRSWSAAISYRRPLGGWPEMVCAENPQGHFPGTHAAVPTADKPNF